MGLLRSKVVGIVFAAVLVGVTGSALAVLTAVQPATGASGSTGAALANGASSSASSTTGSPSASSTTGGSSNNGDSGNPGDSATPTDTAAAPTAAPTATRTPRPTATAPQPGQVNLQGRVISVGSSSFVLSVSGRQYTCNVSSSTTFTGAAIAFANLRQDMIATVTGTLQSDQIHVTTSTVFTQLDN